MKRRQDIDDILKQWPFDPLNVNVRLLELRKRAVLQMRVDMGILQMETEGRPDGNRFQGAPTYFDYLQKKARGKSDFKLDEAQCFEIDREFVQFYHRRVCWLQLKEFDRAVRDAEHTLKLMDFCKQHSPDEQWTISHEQYRPFVLYHRTQAAALSWIERQEFETDLSPEEAAELAIEEINAGLAAVKSLFAEYEADEQYEEDEMVQRLHEFREGLREKYQIGMTTQEQLSQAIANENYELAAELRDRLNRQKFQLRDPE
jgi:hypothetical protein